MRKILCCICAILIPLVAFGRGGQAGPSTVVQDTVSSIYDANEIIIKNRRVCFYGILGPENSGIPSQVCKKTNGEFYPCTDQARQALSGFLKGKTVTCNLIFDKPPYRTGCTMAVCSVDGKDIGAAMVNSGLAKAEIADNGKPYNKEYAKLEQAAKAKKRGFWAGVSDPPWKWRGEWGSEVIRGPATVIGAGAIEIEGRRICLRGISAPEPDYVCETADGTSYPCGQQAKRALSNFVGKSVVTCELTRIRSVYGEPEGVVGSPPCTMGTCTVNGNDLSAALLHSGMAKSEGYLGKEYDKLEQAAKAKKRGFWIGNADPPWRHKSIFEW